MAKKKTTEEFIKDSIEVHGDKYDYSKSEYINAKTKIIIICPKHGEFEQKPNNHLGGQRCGECFGNKKNTINKICNNCNKSFEVPPSRSQAKFCSIACRAIKIMPKQELTGVTKICKNCNKDFYVQAYRAEKANFCSRECGYKHKSDKNKKVCPICQKSFTAKKEQTYCSRECGRCSPRSIIPPKRLMLPRITKQCLHCSAPFIVPNNSKKKYCSRKCNTSSQRRRASKVCKHCGKSFEVRLYLKESAKFCSNSCSVNFNFLPYNQSKKYTYEQVKLMFEERNCKLISTDYQGYHKHLKYICNCGNQSFTALAHFLNGKRCKKCAGQEKPDKNYMENFYRSNGCELLDEYDNHYTGLQFKCKCGCITKRSWYAFYRSPQCSYCSNKGIPLIDEIDKHFNLHECELLTEKYINSNEHLKYICKCGNKGSTSWSNFKKGKRCGLCKNSRGENKIYEYLKQNKIIYEPQWKPKTKKINAKFDMAVKINRAIALIEYNGEQHYIPVNFGSKKKHAKLKNLLENIQRDNNKLQWCQNQAIPLLMIPYWDYDRIPEILDAVISGKTPTFSETPKIVDQHKSMRKKIRECLKIEEEEVLCGLINS